MKKVMVIEGKQYTISEITAIPHSDITRFVLLPGKEYLKKKSKRQNALLVSITDKIGNTNEKVVFGFKMPIDDCDMYEMLDERDMWDGEPETMDSVKEK